LGTPMASLNPLTREVVFKIVFYGPGLGGKTTTLQHIHAASKPEHRGKMVSLATPMDRTLYFDFLPLRMPLVHGMHVRLQLFTVPGQVYFGATRKLVLTGADGVVFVADSQVGRQDANQEAFEDLVMNLADNNLPLAGLPHTFHWNKRDLPDIVSIADLDRTLNPQGAPSLGTVATQGEGVFAGLERITRLVFKAYEAELPKGEAEPAERPPVERAPIEETTIADALRGLTETSPRGRGTPPEAVSAVRAGPPSSHGPPSSSASPISSLESIPNPIPRRATSSFEAAGASSRGAVGGMTPVPSADSGVKPVRSPTPVPARLVQTLTSATLNAVATTATSSPQAAPISSAESFASVAPAALAAQPSPVPPSVAARERESPQPPQPDWEKPRSKTLTGPPPASRSGSVLQGFTFGPLWAAGLAGNAEAPRDPGLVVLLLGLEGRRYLAFRTSVRAARAHEAVSSSEALEAYAFALEVRRALTAITR
jgi:signal recognition particle receptor subunit beta